MGKIILGFAILLTLSLPTNSSENNESFTETKPRFDPNSSENLFPDEKYPEESRRLEEEGTALIVVEVLEDGSPAKAELVRSSGYPRLDEAALTWYGHHGKYFPGTKNGKPRVDWKVFSVTFKTKKIPQQR